MDCNADKQLERDSREVKLTDWRETADGLLVIILVTVTMGSEVHMQVCSTVVPRLYHMPFRRGGMVVYNCQQ